MYIILATDSYNSLFATETYTCIYCVDLDMATGKGRYRQIPSNET